MPNTIEVMRKNLPQGLRTQGDLGNASFRTLWRAVLLELAATGSFVFYACGSAIVAAQMQVSSSSENLFVALIQGLAISAFVYAISRVSGGHLNPAVTLSMLISNNIGVVRAICYIVVQVAGAIAGTALLKAVIPNNIQLTVGLGCTTLSPYTSPGQGFLLEFLVTCGLLFTIYGTAMSRDKTASGVAALSPIPIGYAVTIGVGIAYTFTGGSLNPARSFAPALISSTWKHHWVYWLGPCAAAVFVGVTERFVKLTTYANDAATVSDPSASMEDGLSGGITGHYHALQVILEPGGAPVPMIPLQAHPKWWSKTHDASNEYKIPSFKSLHGFKKKKKEPAPPPPTEVQSDGITRERAASVQGSSVPPVRKMSV